VSSAAQAARWGTGVRLPAQRDENLAVTFAGTQGNAGHRGAFRLQQQRGVRTERLGRQFSP
jgi:hypothetical protein